jgi:Zn finger protein HypA/HybF involved in hydrogenase expression
MMIMTFQKVSGRRQRTVSLPDWLDEYSRAEHISLSDFLQKGLIAHSGRLGKGLEVRRTEAELAINELKVSLALKQASLASIQAELEAESKAEVVKAEELAENDARARTHCKECGAEGNEKKLASWQGFCPPCYQVNCQKNLRLEKEKGQKQHSA